MAKKKDASSALVSGSAEALGLRRSGRETPSKKQATASPLNTRNSERSEKQTSPNPSPAKKKPEKIEKPTGPSPLRRSDRGKKLAEVSGLPDIKSKKKKSANSARHSAGDVNEVKENGRQDSNVSDRKRKKFTIHHYKALFQPQRIHLEIVEYKNPEGKDKSPQANTSNNEACLDVDKELKSLEVVDQTVAADSVCQQMNSFTEGYKVSLNSRRVQGIPDKDQKMFLAGNSMVLQQVEHVGCPSQTKPNDGKFTESGNVEKQIGDSCSPSNKNLADGDNHISHTSSSMVDHDLENHQECDSCDKVTRTCKAAAVMVNAENDDAATNLQISGNTCISSKFVEFWVPVQISNVQLEQYCATLLSNATILRSCSKTDNLGALSGVFVSNQKCCNHPYLVDPHLEQLITKDLEPSMMFDAGIKASGKLRFLDLILPEVKKRQQKVLVLFQPTRGIGNILEDFVLRRFGQESYERVDAPGLTSSKKQAALNKFNKEMSRFIFLLESRARNQSIKLLSVDIIIIFDSDLIPATDLRSLQKVNIDSPSEPIMIFRLYSSSTLEEKILKLAEQNLAIDIRSQTLRYHALLTWGASELFNKLSEFHTASVRSISSDGSLTKDVVEEFLYIVSHKSKSRDSVKSLITRVQNFGIYGKNIPLHSEIKTHLPNGDQPHVFWRNLLEGRNPLWIFVPDSTPRQRKRPNYFLDSLDEESGMDGGGVKTRRRTVISTIEPAQWKPVIEGGSRGINEGCSGPPVHNESQSSSGDPTAVTNEMSLHDLLKPTVSELCSVFKFTEDVTIIVERFLEFVLEKFRVVKDQTSTIQAFMISLCWIGASLAQYNIDRSESFALATKRLNFGCLYEEADLVYKKLEQAKESFLQHTKILDALKECISTPQEVKLDTEKCQHTQTVDVSENHESSNEEEADKYKKQMEDLPRKVQNEINEFNKDWDEKRANLENHYNVEGALIRLLNSNNSSVRSEKLNILEKEYANKLDEHERLREIHFKDLKAKPLAVNEELSLHVCQHETQVSPSLCENPVEAQSHDEPDHDTYASIPNVTEGDDADKIESTRSHTPDKQMADATVSSEPVGEIPAQQNDDMEIDMAVADTTVLSEPVAEVPAQQHDDMTGDVAVETDLAEMELPLVDSNQEHASLGGNSPDRSHASEDGGETAPCDVMPYVDSEEAGMPGGSCDKENAEDRTISPDTLHAAEGNNEVGHNDVGSHVDSTEASTPADNYNEENIGDNDTRPDTSSHAFEDHNDLCGSNNNNSLSADVSLDKTPLVQPSTTPPSDHTMQTIPEIENVSLRVQQSPDTGVQDKDGQVDLSSLADTSTGQLGQITLEDSPLDPHNELILPSSTDPLVLENQPDIIPLSGLLIEHSTEPTLIVSQSGDSLEEHLVAAETPLGEYESSLPSSDAPPLPPPINPLDRFDNLNQVGARMPNHGDPLKAELERLCTVAHSVTKYHEDIKQRLDFDCEKEINEATAQIRRKYEAMHQEADAAFHAKKKQLDTNLNRVCMNRILAEAFRAKCQDLTPSVRSGMQQVSQAGLMQQLHRVSGPSSMRRSPGTASTSPGQAPGSQQSTPPPPSPPRSLPPQPPLQIVHQPAALFSSTPSRPQHSTNLQHPSTESIGPPPNTNPLIIDSMPTRPLSNMDPTSPSTAPIRPPPIINTVTPSTTPTTSRPPPVINTITPSTTSTASRVPPGINPITPSSTPSTSRPPPVSRPITPSSTSNRPSPGVNPINSSSTQNRSPYITNISDMSAANLRINAETRGQTSHVRPVANGEARTPPPSIQSVPSSEIRSRSPHMRSAISSEPRAPGPHMRSMVSGGIRAPAPHMRSVVSSEIRAPALHIRPFRSASDFATQRGMPQGQHVTSSLPLASTSNSQSPLPTSSQQLLPALPPEASFVPQPPPPSSLPSTSSPLPHSSSHIPLQRIPSVTTSGGPSLASTDNLNVVMDIMDIYNSSRSSGNYLVCLSDDD